ncbi:hypothetical protein H6785_01315 [Candidatus Nomurabacteria bacterium]|nr:hypothetical protein [Candidatus Nomurabacteria bacterium]
MSLFEGYNLENCVSPDECGYRWMKEGLPDQDFLRTRWRLRRTLPTAQEHLQRHATDFPWGELCLQHGQVSKPPSYRTNITMVKRGGFLEPGHCFRNSLRAVQRWKEKPPEWAEGKLITYVKGLALDPTGIFLHGWIDVDGQAVDLTFMRAHMTTYFGVRFEPDWAIETCRQINKYGIFHTWEKSQPLLEEKLAA